MPSSIVAGKLPRGSSSVISSTWTRHRRKSLRLWESFWRWNSIYLWVRKSHIYGCDTPLRRPGSWRNNFLRRRTWRLRHDTLVRRRVSQRLVFATSRLRQALVRQGPGLFISCIKDDELVCFETGLTIWPQWARRSSGQTFGWAVRRPATWSDDILANETRRSHALSPTEEVNMNKKRSCNMLCVNQ